MSEQQQMLSIIRQIAKYAGFALAIAAGVKLAGFHQVPGDIQLLALVSIALSVARL